MPFVVDPDRPELSQNILAKQPVERRFQPARQLIEIHHGNRLRKHELVANFQVHAQAQGVPADSRTLGHDLKPRRWRIARASGVFRPNAFCFCADYYCAFCLRELAVLDQPFFAFFTPLEARRTGPLSQRAKQVPSRQALRPQARREPLPRT